MPTPLSLHARKAGETPARVHRRPLEERGAKSLQIAYFCLKALASDQTLGHR